jgi:hypothetical protein
MLVLPKMFRVSQIFERPQVVDISATTLQELSSMGLREKIRSGQKIGVTVGSRGIQNLIPILQLVVKVIKEQGGIPYLIAAMGSHGGGNATGQKEMLDSLGITEIEIGAPVVTCDQCETIGHSSSGLPVFTLKSALDLDGIFVVNRVKTHTSFKGAVESGLIKKLVVGLGGPKGAQQFHGFGPGELARLLLEIGSVLIAKLPILGGLAIVENAYEETAKIQGVAAAEMMAQEPELLAYSKALMPALPTDRIDLLIIEEMGKNFSGAGIDTNIIGRARIHSVPEPELPSIKRIAILDISEESHGNATGIGMADFVTSRLVEKMDRQATYLNCLTSTFVVRAAIPMYFDTDIKLFEAALYSLCSIPPEQLRIVLIPNTLYLTECYVSETIAQELSGRSNLKISDQPEAILFDKTDKLLLSLKN